MEPIIEFKSNAELRECLKYWQNILYLNDWIFDICLEDAENMLIDGKPQAGTNHLDFVHKCSVVKIAKRTETTAIRIVKIPHEAVLVHELLHCKYNWIGGDQYVQIYVETTEHALLEQMARSLIMAKYGLTPDWFNNVREDD